MNELHSEANRLRGRPQAAVSCDVHFVAVNDVSHLTIVGTVPSSALHGTFE